MSVPLENKGRCKRPQGVSTRGHTHQHRLRQSATFISIYNHAFHQTEGSTFVDLGIGSNPVTTVEWKEALDRCERTKNVVMVGTDISPQRVRYAQRYARDALSFRMGGFNTALKPGEKVFVLRAMNILRQYAEEDVFAAHQLMGESLEEGGLLLEGTSSPLGRQWTANILRRRKNDLVLEGIVFGSTILNRDLSFKTFASLLPKNFVHQVTSCPVLARFFREWGFAMSRIAPMRLGIRRQMILLSQQLGDAGFSIKPTSALKRGMMVWNIANDIPGDANDVIYRRRASWDKTFSATMTGQ